MSLLDDSMRHLRSTFPVSLSDLARRLRRLGGGVVFDPAWDLDEPLELDSELVLQAPVEARRIAALKPRELTVSGAIAEGEVALVEALEWMRLRLRDRVDGWAQLTLRRAADTPVAAGNEEAAIVFRRGTARFKYSTHGSKLPGDAAARRAFFAELAQRLELPLDVQPQGEDFRLLHREGGCLSVSGAHGSPPLNPISFECACAGWPSARLASALGAAVETLPGGVVLDREWSVWTDEPKAAVWLLDEALTHGPPASQYEIELLVRWRRLPRLKHLCPVLRPGDRARTTLGDLHFDRDQAELALLTVGTEHRLELTEAGDSGAEAFGQLVDSFEWVDAESP
jgi:hypothetical protein